MSVQICQGQLNKVDIFQFSCISFELKGCWAWIKNLKPACQVLPFVIEAIGANRLLIQNGNTMMKIIK